jgi:uncharacterized protein YeaO (DUF488 family)
MTVRVARVYAGRVSEPGWRVLVDRLWPRGVSRVQADLDEWCRDVAPSNELRQWYAHDPDLAAEFGERYRAELTDPAEGSAALALEHLREMVAAHDAVVLLTSVKELALSHAAVLAEMLGQPAADR